MTTAAARPPGTLYIYTWRRRPVFMRLKVTPGPLPGCPLLHDAIWEIPVVAEGPRPLGVRCRQVPLFHDFFNDVLDKEDDTP